MNEGARARAERVQVGGAKKSAARKFHCTGVFPFRVRPFNVELSAGARAFALRAKSPIVSHFGRAPPLSPPEERNKVSSARWDDGIDIPVVS